MTRTARMLLAVGLLAGSLTGTGHGQVRTNATPERVTLERYGFSFAVLPDWHFVQREPRGIRLFDMVRLFEAPVTAERNRRVLYDALAARAYMLAESTAAIGNGSVQYAQQVANDIRLQGYELVANRFSRDNDIPLLSYVFRYKPPLDSREREIWLSLRFFLTKKYVFSFYGSARSERELEQVTTLFTTIRFLTNADGSLRQP